MDRIWAPWRKAYLRPKGRKEKGCLFCRLLAEKRDSRNYILKRTPFSFAILNLYPYNNGHVMIVPNRHVDSVHALSDHEKLDWLSLFEEIQAGLKKALKPQGFNAGINIGRVGGAGIPHHLHLHVVPRWKGDVNFMPVVGDTKVISESLDSVYQALTQKLKARSGLRSRSSR
jgi:ATP adenylyltransferase